MIRSMTAYGSGEYRQEDTLLTAETRSYNNRYRDIILRIPKNFQSLERDLKSIISSKIRRGHVEASVQIDKNVEKSPYTLKLNMPLVKSYFHIFKQLAQEFGLDQKVRLESFCQMKDVILVKPEEVDLDEIRPGLQEALIQSLDSLDEMRTREGQAIEADFLKRLNLLEQYVIQIKKRYPDLVEEYSKRLKDKINHLMRDIDIDEDRLAQEVAFLAEKSDITEEIVRIKSHLNQFREYLSTDDAVGRRLDFLIQEINREVNTLGTKASDSLISRVVVEMKSELEKLREQVQNVE